MPTQLVADLIHTSSLSHTLSAPILRPASTRYDFWAAKSQEDPVGRLVLPPFCRNLQDSACSLYRVIIHQNRWIGSVAHQARILDGLPFSSRARDKFGDDIKRDWMSQVNLAKQVTLGSTMSRGTCLWCKTNFAQFLCPLMSESLRTVVFCQKIIVVVRGIRAVNRVRNRAKERSSIASKSPFWSVKRIS